MVFCQEVTCTGQLSLAGPNTAIGTVNLRYGTSTIASAILDANGVATLVPRNKLQATTYPLVAVYAGDTNNFRSTSPGLTEVVHRAVSAAAVSSSQNPSTLGQAVTFTALITSPTVTPKGPVRFTAGSTVLGTVALSSRGMAKLTTSALPQGSDTVTVNYVGTVNIKASSASVSQTVR
jgi:hypothetical protein